MQTMGAWRVAARAAKDELLELLWPSGCIACDALSLVDPCFCAPCARQILPYPSDRCPCCGAPVVERCLRCASHLPSLDALRAAYEHDGAIAQAIYRFKFRDRADLAQRLAALLAATPPPDGILVPIPPHEKRFRSRGYDHLALLTVALGKLLHRPVAVELLVRTKATRPQLNLTRAERKENVAQAFAAPYPLSEKPIVLVDDIVTTGATAEEAARTLKLHGAPSVRLFALARAPFR